LYVGRLEKYKNVHILIKSMVNIPDQYELVIIGDGPYKIELIKLIYSLKLNNRVKIYSGLSDEEMYGWYKSCNLVVNFSQNEAFGITVIEGLAAGKPVMVNDKTALIELANKFDQVYPLDVMSLSSEEIANHLLKRATNTTKIPELSEYNWDYIAKSISNLYEESINIKDNS